MTVFDNVDSRRKVIVYSHEASVLHDIEILLTEQSGLAATLEPDFFTEINIATKQWSKFRFYRVSNQSTTRKQVLPALERHFENKS